MRYVSISPGIEAATQAWHALGWEPSFFSQIDAFTRAGLQHHYPGVPLHGDFTTIEDNTYEAGVELLVGGTALPVIQRSRDCGKAWEMTAATCPSNIYRLDIRLRPAGWSGRTSPASFRPSAMPRPIHVRRMTLWTWHSTARRWKLKTSTIQKNYTPSAASWPDFHELGYGFAYRVLDAQHVRTCRHLCAVPTAPPSCVRCRIFWRLATCRRSTF